MHLLRADHVSWVSCLSGPLIRVTDSFCSELGLVVIALAVSACLGCTGSSDLTASYKDGN